MFSNVEIITANSNRIAAHEQSVSIGPVIVRKPEHRFDGMA